VTPPFILLRSDLFEVQIYSIQQSVLKQLIHCNVTITPKTTSNKLNSQTIIKKKHYTAALMFGYLNYNYFPLSNKVERMALDMHSKQMS
jgi:hypothetical protein